MAASDSDAPFVPPRRAVLALLICAAIAVGPTWSPRVALLLSDLVGYFPSLFAQLPGTWDPMVQGGTPLLPNPQAGAFYPPAWLLARDLQAGLPLFLFLHYALAGLATWAWARTRFGDRLPSLLAGIAVLAAGPTLSLALTPDKLPGHALTPLFLLGLHWWLGDDRVLRRRAGLLLTVAATALTWFAGSIESIFILGMAGPLWAAFLPGAEAPSLRRGVAAVFALGLGTAAAGALLVPFFVLLPETARAGALPLAEAMQRSTWPVDWLGWLSPNPFWSGDELRYVLDDADTTRARWLRSLYGGAVLVGLLPAAIRASVPGARLAAVGAVAFVVLALGDASPLAPLVHALPGLGSVRYPDKWWLGAVPLQGWLVACAVSALGTAEGRRRALVGLGLLSALAAVGVLLPYAGGPAQRALSRLALALPFLLLAAAAVHRGPRWGWLLALVAAADLLGAGARSLPANDRDAHRLRPGAIAAIRADRARIPPASLGPPRLWDESLHVHNALPAAPPGEAFRAKERAVLAPNYATEHGVAYIDGMRALRMARQAAFSGPLEDLDPAARRHLLRHVGAEYWLTYTPAEAQALLPLGLRPVPAAPGVPLPVGLLAEPDPLPRVRFVRGIYPVPDAITAYRTLQARPGLHPLVVIDGDPHVDRLLPGVQGKAQTTLTPRHPAPGRWEADYVAEVDGTVVVAETWAPGWEASLDGGPFAPCARVDHLLIGAPAPAGEHSIVLRYRPAGLGWGLAVSLLALLATGGLAWRMGRPPEP